MAAKASKASSRAGTTPGLSIVVPLFNEANGLANLHARVLDVAGRLKAERGLAIEVVYVDDGSRDATGSVASTLPA
ncbi:MAG: glycosyltransferase, partial [Bradyrhizobium sp.]